MKPAGDDNNAKRTFLCECTKATFVAGDTVSIEFIWPGPAPRGGQFFLIKPRRTGVFLARPVSVAGCKKRGAGAIKTAAFGNTVVNDERTDENLEDNDSGILTFLVVRRGRGSRDLTDLRPGEEAELTGPLGNYWEQAGLPRGPIALVGGGVGIAPLVAFARELDERNTGPKQQASVPGTPVSGNFVPYDFYAGFRTGSFGLENLKPNSLIIASEDGSEGLKGRIPDFFTPSGYSRVFVCGPEPMLRAVGDACIAAEVPCFISVERYMACGVGACLGCTVKTTGGNRRCCADGPIFNAEEIIFDKR